MSVRYARATSTLVLPAPGAAQDAAAGQRAFNLCRARDAVDQDGRNGIGPNLHGSFGSRTRSAEGFRHSPAMRGKVGEGLTWTGEVPRACLADSKAVVPAGSMTFAGLRNPQQPNDRVACLRQATGAP